MRRRRFERHLFSRFAGLPCAQRLYVPGQLGRDGGKRGQSILKTVYNAGPLHSEQADVQARSGTLYIRNGNDIGDLLVTKGDRPTVDITLAAAEFKGDLTIGAGLTVTIHQNGFQGKLTGTVKNEGSIVWDPAQAE